MFGKLIETWQARKAVKLIENHPILGEALRYLRNAANDTSQGFGKYYSDDGKAQIVTRIIDEMQQLLAGPNPAQAIRMRTCEFMLITAETQVLVIDPPPAPDVTGLRNFEGITGELQARIPELTKANEGLEKFFYSLSNEPKSFQDYLDVIEYRYFSMHLSMSAYNKARIALGDKHANVKRDWFRPAFTSFCIWQENTYREELSMPRAISGDDADLKALLHSTWMNRLQEGIPDPRLAWEKSWEKTFKGPSPYRDIVT
jgi:hypothetical protein